MKVKMIGDEVEMMGKVTSHLLWSKPRMTKTSVTELHKETVEFMKAKYNADYQLLCDEEYVEFQNEQDYVLFKLEWS